MLKDALFVAAQVTPGLIVTAFPYSSSLQNGIGYIVGENYVSDWLSLPTQPIVNLYFNFAQLWASMGSRFILRNYRHDQTVWDNTTRANVLWYIFDLEAYSIALVEALKFFYNYKIAKKQFRYNPDIICFRLTLSIVLIIYYDQCKPNYF